MLNHEGSTTFPNRIEVWDERDIHVEELVALVGDHAVATAASTRR
jgi:hypothetical protein